MTAKPIYITGNPGKAKYLAQLLDIKLDHKSIELDEIQSLDPKKIVEHKVRQAYAAVSKPVLVEDTCMGIDELGGLPGPFIKHFLEIDDGAGKLCRMCDGLTSRRATATTTFGYFDGVEMVLFQGQIHGRISDRPGKMINGFGWDAVFIPDGCDGQIRSELSSEDYDRHYLELKPIAAVHDFLMAKLSKE